MPALPEITIDTSAIASGPPEGQLLEVVQLTFASAKAAAQGAYTGELAYLSAAVDDMLQVVEAAVASRIMDEGMTRSKTARVRGTGGAQGCGLLSDT